MAAWSRALPRRSRMSALSVVSAACLITSIRWRSPAIERADKVRPCFSRSASASSADCALRAPVRALAKVAPPAPQPPRLLPEKRLDQAQQRAPTLHRAAEVVHRLGVGLRRIFDRRACLGEDVAGDAAQRLPHRHARPQGGFLLHWKNIGHYRA